MNKTLTSKRRDVFETYLRLEQENIVPSLRKVGAILNISCVTVREHVRLLVAAGLMVKIKTGKYHRYATKRVCPYCGRRIK
jgi:Mn-dependent DtxR family transcriptional regulator